MKKYSLNYLMAAECAGCPSRIKAGNFAHSGAGKHIIKTIYLHMQKQFQYIKNENN